ncbi:xanthine dehydrogenase family protein molybdopterin-binding subunit [Sphingomonas sp.]|uniref:xanthine dehydrogenase family protein molybdopterin-binding subunit n=1 Tax=Sphingomonas sp. TaxID=28214 RepID=UPI0035BBA983
MTNTAFPDRARIDARDKVRGANVYAADVQVPGLLYAMLVPSTAAKGTITTLDTAPAMRVPGVVRVLTADDFPPLPPAGPAASARAAATNPVPTIERAIAYCGQPVALVVAETLEAAIQGAEAVKPVFATQSFAATIDSPGGQKQLGKDKVTGDPAQALAGAAATVDAAYESPKQHHNPMEMISTTAIWANGRLTIHEGSQVSGTVKVVVAKTLGLDPAVVEVKSPSVGGAFGQKGGVQRQTAIVARAAILIGRPVKLVVPRGQVFHIATFRPNSRHHVRLGADAGSKLVAARYDTEQQQARAGFFRPDYHQKPRGLYAIPNYGGSDANIAIDTQAPGYMRAPAEHPSCFAFESAIDELAFKMGQDPVAFRITNDTRVDPESGQPLSSRWLKECLTEGARRFGWEKRSAAPGSMTAPDGTQVGWGVASGIYPAVVTPAIATLRIGADGSTRFATSGHEMGQGIRTAIAAVLIDELGADPNKLDIRIGDTSAAPQHLTAGSWGTFSSVPVAAAAVTKMRAAVAELLGTRKIAGTLHRQLAVVRRPFLEIEVSQLGPGQKPEALEALKAGQYAIWGPRYPGFATFSYIAHFVEVRIEPTTRRIRMPRVVSIADCGRVVSPRTARSQVQGGVVGAFGAALREAGEVDPRYGGVLNDDLADYVVPVNADIGDIEVDFINQPDPLANSVGVKGLGEVAMVGAAAAIANAVFHATGRRIRELPIRIEHLL